jgi:DNA-binding Lrp family transcriptional regulator
MTNVVALDEFDLRILTALQEDGRLGNEELAKRVNLSASQCSRRRIRLEEQGVLRRYRAEIDAALVGLNITVSRGLHSRPIPATTPGVSRNSCATSIACSKRIR